MRHRVRGKGDGDHLAAGEERVDLLQLGRHHLHPPGFGRQRRNRHEVVLLEIFDRLQGEFANQGGLFSRFDVEILDLLKRFLPVVAKAHLGGGFLHLGLAPGEFLVGDHDELLGRIRNERLVELRPKNLRPHGVADNRVAVRRIKPRHVLAEVFRIRLKRLLGGFVRLGVPPSEQGVVAVVKLVPFGERRVEFTRLARGPHRGLPGNLFRPLQPLLGPLLSGLDRFFQLKKLAGGLLGVDRIELPARLGQCGDITGERKQRARLAEKGSLVLQVLGFAADLGSQQEIVHLAGLIERVKLNPVERVGPAVDERLEPLQLGGRWSRGDRPLQTPEVDLITLDDFSHRWAFRIEVSQNGVAIPPLRQGRSRRIHDHNQAQENATNHRDHLPSCRARRDPAVKRRTYLDAPRSRLP